LRGSLADRFGYKIVLATGTLVTGIVVYPLFVWIDLGTAIATSVALTVFALTNGCIQGAMPVAMVDMFPPRLRFSGMAIGLNLMLALFGSTAPMVATWLIKTTGRLTAPACYLIVVAAVTFLVTLTVQPHPENRGPKA
jgi:MFS transporter, MHS family, proline/betaine transporter